MHLHSPSTLCSVGAVGSGGVHQGRKGHRIQAVCGNDPDTYRGSPCCVPQTDEYRQAAHLCRDGQRPLRLPAAGKALHGPHHHQKQQHPGRPGDAQTVLPCGKSTNINRTSHILLGSVGRLVVLSLVVPSNLTSNSVKAFTNHLHVCL